jgi:hypothetical protein
MIVTNQRGSVKVGRCFQAIKWITPRWTGDLDVVRELRKIEIGDWVDFYSTPFVFLTDAFKTVLLERYPYLQI